MYRLLTQAVGTRPPSRAVISAAVSRTSSPSSSRRASGMRATGPETEMAARGMPCSSWRQAATQCRPIACSSRSQAKPWRRISASPSRRVSGVCRVFSVTRESPCSARMRSSSSSGSQAISALPTPEACSGAREPSRVIMRIIWGDSLWARKTAVPPSRMPRLAVSPVWAVRRRRKGRLVPTKSRASRKLLPMRKVLTSIFQTPSSLSWVTKPWLCKACSRRWVVEGASSACSASSESARPPGLAERRSRRLSPRTSDWLWPPVAFPDPAGRPAVLRLTSLTLDSPRIGCPLWATGYPVGRGLSRLRKSLPYPARARPASHAIAGTRCCRWRPELAMAPLGGALLDKGVDALAGVLRHHVAGHHLPGEGVGLLQGHLQLALEHALAGAYRHGALGADAGGELAHGLVQGVIVGHTVDQSPLQGRPGVDELAGEQHFHGPLAAHVARQRHRRGGAEEPSVDAGDGEARRARCHREVAAGHQLAAGGGGDALHPGDDRYRQLDDGLHDPAAAGEELLVVGLVRVGAHLLEVVTGAEGAPLGGDHHAAHAAVVGQPAQLLLEGKQHLLGEGVEAAGTTEGKGGHAAFVAAPQRWGRVAHHGLPVVVGVSESAIQPSAPGGGHALRPWIAGRGPSTQAAASSDAAAWGAEREGAGGERSGSGAFGVEHPHLEGVLHLAQGVQGLGAVGLVDVDHHVADLLVGLQVLAGDVDVVLGEHAVDLGEHARHVVMDVQQAVLVRVGRQGDLGEVDRGDGGAVVGVGHQLLGDLDADVLLGLQGGAADVRGEDDVVQAAQGALELLVVALGLHREDIDGRSVEPAGLD